MNPTKATKKKARIKIGAEAVQNIAILIIFAILCLVGYILQPQLFFTIGNITNILISASSVIIVASAVTLVIITGNLDLSVGGIGAMGAVVFALFAKAGIPVLPSAALAVLCGLAFGFLNGLIISKLSLPSFIISLAFKFIAGGIALIGAGGAIISFGLPGNIGIIGQTISGVPLPVVYAIVVFLIFLFIQNKTVFAKQCYAIGANITAANLSGINSVKVITGVYALSGLLAAFAGVVITSRFSVADSGILPGFEADVIIAAVLGGTKITGGRGTVFGTLIGALIVVVLTNITNMLGMAIYTQDMLKGFVLIFAILLNQAIQKFIKV